MEKKRMSDVQRVSLLIVDVCLTNEHYVAAVRKHLLNGDGFEKWCVTFDTSFGEKINPVFARLSERGIGHDELMRAIYAETVRYMS
jgi:hypothetical protein